MAKQQAAVAMNKYLMLLILYRGLQPPLVKHSSLDPCAKVALPTQQPR
jgi:hypothetical protein